MREIKFRGKLIGTGEWVFGAYIGNYGKPFIVSHNVVEYCEEYFLPEFWWRVDRNTVGQYTGLRDKNGREIYEDDLLQSQIGDKHIWRVLFEDGAFILEQIAGHKRRNGKKHSQDFCCRDDIELYQLVVIDRQHPRQPGVDGGGD